MREHFKHPVSFTEKLVNLMEQKLVSQEDVCDSPIPQLTNVYVLFALNEALVLRSILDIKVWRTIQELLMIVDFGHLCIVFGLGADVRWH